MRCQAYHMQALCHVHVHITCLGNHCTCIYRANVSTVYLYSPPLYTRTAWPPRSPMSHRSMLMFSHNVCARIVCSLCHVVLCCHVMFIDIMAACVCHILAPGSPRMASARRAAPVLVPKNKKFRGPNGPWPLARAICRGIAEAVAEGNTGAENVQRTGPVYQFALKIMRTLWDE